MNNVVTWWKFWLMISDLVISDKTESWDAVASKNGCGQFISEYWISCDMMAILTNDHWLTDWMESWDAVASKKLSEN